MPNQTVKNSLKAKNIILPQMNFVLEKQLTKFSCTYYLLSFCKIFIKTILELIQRYQDVHHFWDQNSSFVLNKKSFWYKLLLLLSSTYGPFHWAKFLKKSCNGSRIMAMHHFWAQSGSFAWNNFFSKNLLMSLVSFIHAYLHSKN